MGQHLTGERLPSVTVLAKQSKSRRVAAQAVIAAWVIQSGTSMILHGTERCANKVLKF